MGMTNPRDALRAWFLGPRAENADLVVWDDAPLPKLPELYSEIFVREGGARAIYEQLADDINAIIYQPDAVAQLRATTAA